MASCEMRPFFHILRRFAETTRKLALGIHDTIPHHHHHAGNHGHYSHYHYDFYGPGGFEYSPHMTAFNHSPGEWLVESFFTRTLAEERLRPGSNIYYYFIQKLHNHCRRFHEKIHMKFNLGPVEGGSRGHWRNWHSHGRREGREGRSWRSWRSWSRKCQEEGRQGYGRHGRGHGYKRFRFEIPPRCSFDKMRLHNEIVKNIKLKAFAYKCLFLNRLFQAYPHYYNMKGGSVFSSSFNSYYGLRAFFYNSRYNHPFTRPTFFIQNPYNSISFGKRFLSIAPKAGSFELYKIKNDPYKLQEQQLRTKFRSTSRVFTGGIRLIGDRKGLDLVSPSSMMKMLWIQQSRGYISRSNSYTSLLDKISPFEVVGETNRFIENERAFREVEVKPEPRIEEVVEIAGVILQPFHQERILQESEGERTRTSAQVPPPSATPSYESINSMVIIKESSLQPTLPSSLPPPIPVTPFQTEIPFQNQISPTSSSSSHTSTASISPPTESSVVDFDITPRFSLPTAMVDLTEESLYTIEKDMERHLTEIRNIIADIRRIANLGELPISIERNGNIIRVHFPNADAQTVQQLLFDLEVSRGIIIDTVGPNHFVSITPENSISSISSSPPSSSPPSLSPSPTHSLNQTSSSSSSIITTTSSASTPPSFGLARIENNTSPSPLPPSPTPIESWGYVGPSSISDIPTPDLTESCGSTISSGDCSSVLMAMRI